MGRPSKLTSEVAATAATLARLGFTDERLAEALGISRSTLSLWKSENEEFSATLREAKSQADAQVVDALHKRATGFVGPDGVFVPPNPTACIFWLKNRMPAEFRDSHRHELTGADGAPIQSAPMVQLSSDQEAALSRVISAAQDRVRRIS